MRVLRVLLVVDTAAHLSEQWRLALLLRDSRRLTPILYFSTEYDGVGRDVERCRVANIAVHMPDRPRKKAHVPRSSRASGSSLQRRSRRVSILPIAVLRWMRHLLRLKKRFIALLQTQEISTVVLPEDNVGTYSAVWVSACSHVSIPSIIIPFAMQTPAAPAKLLVHSADHNVSRLSNRLVARLYPQWVHEYRGKRLMRLPARQALAMEILKMGPPRPWTLHSGYSDRIAAESAWMFRHYVSHGIPEEQLALTGSVADDELYSYVIRRDHLRATLCEKFALDPTRPFVVCSLPTDQFDGSPEGIEFGDYEEMLHAYLVAVVKATKGNFVLRPHPRDLSRAEVLIRSLGLGLDRSITSEETTALVAACDIYVATVSGTIRWALVSSTPALNYDVYRFRYSEYEGVPGVRTVETLTLFEDELEALFSNPGYRERLGAGEAAAEWGFLDGRCGTRLMRLIEDPRTA